MTKTISGLTESTAPLVGDEPVETEVGGQSRKVKARRFGQKHPGRVVGRWYPFDMAQVGNGGTPLSARTYFVPIWIDEKITFSELGVRINTIASGGNIQIGLYGSDPVTKLPTGLPLAKTASLSTTNLGPISGVNAGGDCTVNPGLYYMSVMADATAAAVVQLLITSGSGVRTVWLVGGATLATATAGSSTCYVAYTTPTTYGTWADLTGSQIGAGAGPALTEVSAATILLFFKVSAVF